MQHGIGRFCVCALSTIATARTAHHWHRGMQDKILQSMTGGKEIMVTNDGATILKSLYVDNPAAKVLVGECPGFQRHRCMDWRMRMCHGLAHMASLTSAGLWMDALLHLMPLP